MNYRRQVCSTAPRLGTIERDKAGRAYGAAHLELRWADELDLRVSEGMDLTRVGLAAAVVQRPRSVSRVHGGLDSAGRCEEPDEGAV